MSETPVTRPARQKLSFTLAEEESMVAKTVAVDPHLSGGSEDLGKVPPPHGRIVKPLSEMPQVGRSASAQGNDDALQTSMSLASETKGNSCAQCVYVHTGLVRLETITLV